MTISYSLSASLVSCPSHHLTSRKPGGFSFHKSRTLLLLSFLQVILKLCVRVCNLARTDITTVTAYIHKRCKKRSMTSDIKLLHPIQ